MGDQAGVEVGGQLYYVPEEEFKRLISQPLSAIQIATIFAALCRINVLYMVARAGSGHIGSSFSSMDIMVWIQLNEIYRIKKSRLCSPTDVFFSSKGHDVYALYSTLIGLGKLDFELIHQLRRLGGLPGHPDIKTPSIVTNTGSLGMGVSKAKGMVIANRLKKEPRSVFVLTGDGELQEGQFWESLISASNLKLHELIVIIDHNKMQSDTLLEKVNSLGDLESKLAAFGWHVSRCDGHNLVAFSQMLDVIKSIKEKPKIIIADTIKGKGVSFMEHTSFDSDVELYKYHSGAPTKQSYLDAARELIANADRLYKEVGITSLRIETITRPAASKPKNSERLVAAYTESLIEQASQNSQIVALDADLILDTGLIPFKKQFPDRFVECGIAEQDMVSMAGGMALEGLLPIVHSFSSFLSARSNEQIYNNATEHRKIIYVGSLAGILPGGAGHSHQAVRDISALGAVPGLTIIEPSCVAEVGLLMNWCVKASTNSSYLRLVSSPCVVPYVLPQDYFPCVGRGVTLYEGSDAAIIGYGPLLLSEAYRAAKTLEYNYDLSLKVINLPWLNNIDEQWLLEEVGQSRILILMDNHYSIGGQGDRIVNTLSSRRICKQVIKRIAIDKMPACGADDEVMRHHNLNSEVIVRLVLDFRR